MGLRLINVCCCEECKHVWLSDAVPKRCAKCKSSKWNDHGSDALKEPVEVGTAIDRQTLADVEPIIEQLPPEPPQPTDEEIEAELAVLEPEKEWSEMDKIVARKNNHPPGCQCTACEVMRGFFEKPEEKIGKQSASNRPAKKKAKQKS